MKSSKAAAYVRVSSIDQAEGGSIQRQVDDCRKLATAEKAVLIDGLIFKDFASGAKNDRPAFQRMMDAARNKEFDLLIIWALDRLGRDLLNQLTAMKELKACGVRVLSTKEHGLDNDLILGVLGSVAQAERQRIRERTLPARLKKRDQGYWVVGAAPYGYRVLEDKTLKVVEAEAAIVKRIFDLAEAGQGRVNIARTLNRDGVIPPEVKTKSSNPERKYSRTRTRDGLPPKQDRSKGIHPEWSKRTVARIVDNPMSCGELNGVKMKITPRAIISKGQYERVREIQRSKAQKGRKPDSRSFLAGFVKCGQCGASYVRHVAKGHTRYVCQSKRSGKSCTNPAINERELMLKAVEAASRSLDRITKKHFLSRLARTSKAELQGVEVKLSELENQRDEHANSADDKERRLLAAGVSITATRGIGAEINEHRRMVAKLDREIEQARDALERKRRSVKLSQADAEAIFHRSKDALALITWSPEGPEETGFDWAIAVRNALVGGVIGPDKVPVFEPADFTNDTARLHRILDVVTQQQQRVRELERLWTG